MLGPLLFLLNINDICSCSSRLGFCLFADDTNLLYSHKNLKTREKIVNDELANVYNWLTSNKLSLNLKKSNFVTFRPYQKKVPFTPKLYIYVVVQYYPWFKFSFLLFLGMVMYDNNMIMSLKQKKRKFEPRIKLSHNIYHPSNNKHKQLECREFVKYLGVLIDYKLSWNKDIDTILSKISRTVGLLSKLRHFVPFSTLISIYHSLI